MRNPHPLARAAFIAGMVAVSPLMARPPAPVDPTFYISVTPDSHLLNWGIGILRSDGSGGYNLSFQAGFPDLEGQLTTVGRDEIMVYPTHTGSVTMPVPIGTGDFGYFILGRYQPEISPGDEAGVTVGMSQATATTWTTDPRRVWDIKLEGTSAFPTISETGVYSDLSDATTWAASTSGSNPSFLSQLFAISAKSSIALGQIGSPTQLEIALVTFSEAFTGGSVVLTTTPVPEASTWAAAVVVLGTATFAWQRRRKHQAA